VCVCVCVCVCVYNIIIIYALLVVESHESVYGQWAYKAAHFLTERVSAPGALV
jgi:hypothetical protein